MGNSFTWKKIIFYVFLVFLALYPLLHGNDYLMHIFNMFFFWAVVATNWNLIAGYSGTLSLGNVAFFALGGYISGMLAKYFGWSPWLCILIGGLGSTGIVFLLVGLPSLRLSGIYIALWSLMFAMVLPTLLSIFQDITGGIRGLSEIPPLFEGITPIISYYINFSLFFVVLIIVYKTIHSSNGLAFMALRDSRDFARALGINELKEKLKVFALTSFLTGIAGGVYVHHLGDISPALLGITPFLMGLAMVMVGGLGRFPGAIIGAFIITGASEYFRLAGTWRLSIIGALMCVIILFFPGGIMEFIDLLDEKFVKIRRRAVNHRSSPENTSQI